MVPFVEQPQQPQQPQQRPAPITGAGVNFSDVERARIAEMLSKKLKTEDVAQRPQAGGAVTYLEAHKSFDLANQIFGHDGWNTSIKQLCLPRLTFVHPCRF